ncbi:MAG: aquaporin family protein [Candidatus Obscuribacterales bacterium]|jgi:glycerol uptake facilitator-like aquaporin|nr:aquaporin family protein [Candidatus Obscuribacterales bacterium]
MAFLRALLAEFVGTAFLLATVVGSGIMAKNLDASNVCILVLCVALATTGVLTALIFAFGSISTHFNPAVTLVTALRKEIAWKKAIPYIVVQCLGAIFGTILTNMMFDLPAAQISDTVRYGAGQWLGEAIATFGLIGIILGTVRNNAAAVPFAVSFYVGGAIFFTSSTCFANPAVTIGRVFTATPTGIDPLSVAPFVLTQIGAAIVACYFFGFLFAQPKAKVQASEIEALDRALKNSPDAEPVVG